MNFKIKSKIKDLIQESIYTFDKMSKNDDLVKKIEIITEALEKVILNGGNIFFAGNGGSAADSQHLAAELVGRFQLNRQPIKAQALTTDTSIITAIGNDYSFEDIFKRQIEALGNKGDALFTMSTSGNSKNIIKLIGEAKKKGLVLIGLTGEKYSKMSDLCDYLVQVPSNNTARIQEAHILIGHIICGNLEHSLFGEKEQKF